jgi:hypothetical protein
MDVCKNIELPTKAEKTFVSTVKWLRSSKDVRSQKGKPEIPPSRT